jgi:hypothetical protein
LLGSRSLSLRRGRRLFEFAGESVNPPGASGRSAATPDASSPFARFEPCDYLTEEDYEAVMGAEPETVKRAESGTLRVCTREHAVPENMASVEVAKAPESLLNNMLEMARNMDVRPTPIDVPDAQVYFMDETKTLYAHKNGVYFEMVVRAPQNYREKTIELAKRTLARIP